MIEAFEVRLPISHILVIKPVDHVFAQDQVRQERVGASIEKAGRNEIRLMDRSACVTTADCREHLVAQPTEVGLQLAQHIGRGEVPRQGLMSMQHIARILLYHNVDCVEQALKVAFHSKRRTEVRHDEISNKEHAQIRQMDEHGIVRLSAVNGNQLDACSANFYFGWTVYGCVRLETAHI